jgi:glutamate racemase
MKVGIFDSGVGGLIIAKAIRKAMPEYDYVYLGDTKRVPYGNRSHETVYEFTKQGIEYLFKKENCRIIILACNTASARALRKIQKEYLPKNFPDKKVIGVLIPTAEECGKFNRVGIIGTVGTIESGAFIDEIKKVNNKTKVFQNAAPMLVPLAEQGDKKSAKKFIADYLKAFNSKNIEALALGCTHYPFFKKEIKAILPKKIKVISQDETVPKKLRDYFARHPEITKNLSKNKTAKILVTDITKNIENLAKKWFGKDTKPEKISI